MLKKCILCTITFAICLQLSAKPLHYKTLQEEIMEREPEFSLADSRLNIYLHGPEWYNSFNTLSPYGQNDGALWQGRGYNSKITGGFSLEYSGLSLTLMPVITFSQNLPFKLIPSQTGNQYGNFWIHTMDQPQRFGDTPFFTADLGESEIRYTWKTLTFGFGNQTPWIGPAFLNPLIHSNNAPGYLKIDAGLRKQEIIIPDLGWNLGFIEGRMWVGRLEESDYFDDDGSNNYTLISGFNASWAPSFLPGFTLGLNKVCLTAWTKNFLKYLNPFYNNNDWVTPEDQKMSITLDWDFPESGFELFSEIGMDDYSSSFITNPFHTVVWSAGFKYKHDFIKNNGLTSEIIVEINNLEMSQDFQLQWIYRGYYSHEGVLHGYTNKGQILGNGCSIGGNSQFIGYKIYGNFWDGLLFFHRFCPDNNYVYNKAINTGMDYDYDYLRENYAVFETHLSFGGNLNWYGFDHFTLSGGMALELTYCPQYRATSDYQLNLHFNTGLKYRF